MFNVEFGVLQATVSGVAPNQTATLELEYLDLADGNNGFARGTGVTFPISGQGGGERFLYGGTAGLTDPAQVYQLGGAVYPSVGGLLVGGHAPSSIDWYSGTPDITGTTGSPNDRCTVVFNTPADYTNLASLAYGDPIQLQVPGNAQPVIPHPSNPITVTPAGHVWTVVSTFQSAPSAAAYFRLVLHNGLSSSGTLDDALLFVDFQGDGSATSFSKDLDLSSDPAIGGALQSLEYAYISVYYADGPFPAWPGSPFHSGLSYGIMSYQMSMGHIERGPHADQFRHFLDGAYETSSVMDMGEYWRASEGWRQQLFGIDYDITNAHPQPSYGLTKSNGQPWAYLGTNVNVKQGLLNIETALQNQQTGTALGLNYKDAVANISAVETAVYDDYVQGQTSGNYPSEGDAYFVVAEGDFYVLVFHGAFGNWVQHGYHRPGGNTSSGNWLAMEKFLAPRAYLEITGVGNGDKLFIHAGDDYGTTQYGNNLQVDYTDLGGSGSGVTANFVAGTHTLEITYDGASTLNELKAAIDNLAAAKVVCHIENPSGSSDTIPPGLADGSFNPALDREIGFIRFADDKEAHLAIDTVSLPVENILETSIERINRAFLTDPAATNESDTSYSQSKGFSGPYIEASYPHAHKEFVDGGGKGIRIKAKHDGLSPHAALNATTFQVVHAGSGGSEVMAFAADLSILNIHFDETIKTIDGLIALLAASGSSVNNRIIIEKIGGATGSELASTVLPAGNQSGVTFDNGTNVPTMKALFNALIAEDVRLEDEASDNAAELALEHGYADNLRDVIMDIAPGGAYELLDTGTHMGADPTSGNIIGSNKTIHEALEQLEYNEERQLSREVMSAPLYWGSMILWANMGQAKLRLDVIEDPSDPYRENVMVKFEERLASQMNTATTSCQLQYLDPAGANSAGRGFQHEVTIQINKDVSPSTGEIANLINQNGTVGPMMSANTDGVVGIIDKDDFDNANGLLPAALTKVWGGEDLNLMTMSDLDLARRFSLRADQQFSTANLKMMHINGLLSIIDSGPTGMVEITEKKVRFGDRVIFESSKA